MELETISILVLQLSDRSSNCDFGHQCYVIWKEWQISIGSWTELFTSAVEVEFFGGPATYRVYHMDQQNSVSIVCIPHDHVVRHDIIPLLSPFE